MDRDTVRNIVEFYSENKFEKLAYLVGCIIRIYHDARSSECQIINLHRTGSLSPFLEIIQFSVVENMTRMLRNGKS